MASAVAEPLSFNLLTVRELVTLGPRRMVNLVRRSFSDPVQPKLSELGCPTLLVRGSRRGHTVVYTDPRRLAELVLRFPAGRG